MLEFLAHDLKTHAYDTNIAMHHVIQTIEWITFYMHLIADGRCQDRKY